MRLRLLLAASLCACGAERRPEAPPVALPPAMPVEGGPAPEPLPEHQLDLVFFGADGSQYGKDFFDGAAASVAARTCFETALGTDRTLQGWIAADLVQGKEWSQVKVGRVESSPLPDALVQCVSAALESTSSQVTPMGARAYVAMRSGPGVPPPPTRERTQMPAACTGNDIDLDAVFASGSCEVDQVPAAPTGIEPSTLELTVNSGRARRDEDARLTVTLTNRSSAPVTLELQVGACEPVVAVAVRYPHGGPSLRVAMPCSAPRPGGPLLVGCTVRDSLRRTRRVVLAPHGLAHATASWAPWDYLWRDESPCPEQMSRLVPGIYTAEVRLPRLAGGVDGGAGPRLTAKTVIQVAP